MKKYQLKIIGLDCANCALELEETLQKIKIIENVKIHFFTEKLEFESEETKKEEAMEQIKNVIKKVEPDVKVTEI